MPMEGYASVDRKSFRRDTMPRADRRMQLVHVLMLVALLAPVAVARADDEETREFQVIVDGKDAGLSRMKLVQTDDGTTYMTGSVDVKFRHLLVVDYVLKIETQEWWKNGKLIGVKSVATENGKRTDLTVASENNQLRMRVNGQERTLKTDIWTTSFFKLADAKFHNKQVGVLEVDTGKEYDCELKFLGNKKLKVGSDFVDCYHFRVSAAPGPVELWYDKYHRLVRQEFTDSGHKTIVQLVKISR
jgi:hypothetical protein